MSGVSSGVGIVMSVSTMHEKNIYFGYRDYKI